MLSLPPPAMKKIKCPPGPDGGGRIPCCILKPWGMDPGGMDPGGIEVGGMDPGGMGGGGRLDGAGGGTGGGGSGADDAGMLPATTHSTSVTGKAATEE